MKSIDVVEVKPYLLHPQKKIIIPQPTRFWILNRSLRSLISRLEEKGQIKYWEEKVTQDEELFNFFVELHKKEIEIRKNIIKEANLPPYAVKKLTETGIGGIEKFKEKPFKVKCLHLWTAYHIGDKSFNNPIGEFVLKNILQT